MAPYQETKTVVENGKPKLPAEEKEESLKDKKPYKLEIVWRNVFTFTYLHIASLYGIYLAFTSAKLMTLLFAFFLYRISIMSITMGVHRLWSHRSFKAVWPLRLALMIANSIAFQNDVIEWARDHRVHHKFSETDADPVNSKRGFFFSHVGWLLCRKHPDVTLKGKTVDVSDLYQDPILAFQKKYYRILMPLLCFVMPTVVPVYFWNETWTNAFFIPTLLRYCFALHVTWLINSAAHMYGTKPYDKDIAPVQNRICSILSMGEGWHNYHHTFPWDYRTSELNNFYLLNTTTFWVDLFSKFGWITDLKTAPESLIKSVMKNRGDGSIYSTHMEEVPEPKDL